MANLNETTETKKIVFKGTTIVEYEKEIEVPAYLKHGACKYKILSENVWIKVGALSSLGEDVTIELYKTAPCWAIQVLEGGKPITPAEFNEAFQTALSKIQNL